MLFRSCYYVQMNTCTSNHPSVRLLTGHPHRFARQGAVVAAWRTSRGRRLGPYYRLAWRDGGRQRSIYLGRQGPVVRQVRILLHQAHASRRLKRQARLRAARFRQEVIRPLNQYIQQMFALFGNGLYLKGSEIRGIRQAGPRLSAAHVPAHLIPEFPFPLPAPLAALASPKPEFSRSVDQNNPHQSPPNSEFSPLVDQTDPHRSPPELEFSPFVDQDSPHHPPLQPKPRQVRNPTFTNMRAPCAQVQHKDTKAGQVRNPTFTNMRAPCAQVPNQDTKKSSALRATERGPPYDYDLRTM